MSRDEAIACQVVWKTDAMKRYAVAFVSAALGLARAGDAEVASDDVPESAEPEHPGIAGNVCHMLRRAHVIAPVMVAAGQIKRRKSGRESRNAAWINVYQLTSCGMAEEFLRRNKVEPLPRQMELLNTVLSVSGERKETDDHK